MVLVFKLGVALVAANHGRSLHRARLSGHLPNLTLYEPPLLASLRELTIEPVKGSTSGDPGVGKTELACTLAEARFGEEAAILRIDMSELQERHTVRVEERERVDYTWTVLVTQDTEIEALLGRLTDEIRSGSNGSLVGLYVYGSLVTGDFDKDRSDIDLLAVVDSDVDGETFDRLDRMHARFVEEHPAWEDRIEVAYVPASALWNFRTRTDQIAVISPGEPFHLKAAGKDWLINWYMVSEVGVTLHGPPPRVMIPEIPQSEFMEAVREQAEAWKEWVFKMRTPGAQSYAVLTLCRALYAHTHGRQASKRQAALWAQAYLPQWAPLIEQISLWLSEDQDEGTGDAAGLRETVRFVHDIAGRITGTGESAGPGASG